MSIAFVTVGSQKFQFNRLLQSVDSCVCSNSIITSAFAQTGCCEYVPVHMQHAAFLNRNEFAQRVKDAQIIITHGGTGAIVNALKAGKPVVAMPRRVKYGEHVDDHQVQIVEQFAEVGLIEPCIEAADMANACERAISTSYFAFTSNTDRFLADLDEYLATCDERLALAQARQ